MGAIRDYEHPGELWGILNPYGGLWTSRTFERPEAAWQYVADYWPAPEDRRGYRVVKVVLRVAAIEPLTDAPSPPKWASPRRRP